MDQMELQERKMKILQAIIRNYLETGEPVGSRTISKYTDLNLSSATIRNEMADLEEMGLITQPHTSAGRIPTDKGYRVYVDDILQSEWKKLSSLQEVLLEKEDRLETLLQEVAELLASNTNYTSMISAPAIRGNKIKYVQLSQVDKETILAVIVTEGNIVRNALIHVDQVLSTGSLIRLNLVLNNVLCGMAAEDVTQEVISVIKDQVGEYEEIVEQIIAASSRVLETDQVPKIYTSGTTNILRYPELAGSTVQIGELIHNFEEKKNLDRIVRESLAESDSGIQVYIGKEMPAEELQNCSVVTATYELKEGMRGTVGVIGPKRMDYDRVFGVLRAVMTQLDALYRE